MTSAGAQAEQPTPSADAGERPVIVGAGPAGLSVAYALERTGIQPRILERSDSVCSSWAGHYRALQLNSPRWLSSLPGAPMGPELGDWVARDDFRRYVLDYAARLRTEPELGVEVGRIDRANGSGWRLHTSSGDVLAPAVVVATGLNRKPHWPPWPGRESFAGELVHVADYEDPEPYRGREVLVVGIGASGMDVAMDLLRAGVNVRVSVRTTPVIFRRHWSTSVLAAAMKRLPMPDAVVDPASLMVHRLLWGDMTGIGLADPRNGMASAQRERGHGGTMDRGLIAALKAGATEVVAAVERFEGRDVVLADGRRLQPDAVIAATGQRPNLEPLVGHLGVLGSDGRPSVHGGDTAPDAPGLHFVGYRLPPGQLVDMKPDSRAVARRLRSRIRAARA